MKSVLLPLLGYKICIAALIYFTASVPVIPGPIVTIYAEILSRTTCPHEGKHSLLL